MVREIRLAGFTLTADEWFGLDEETRDELLGVAADDDFSREEETDLFGGPSDIVW